MKPKSVSRMEGLNKIVFPQILPTNQCMVTPRLEEGVDPRDSIISHNGVSIVMSEEFKEHFFGKTPAFIHGFPEMCFWKYNIKQAVDDERILSYSKALNLKEWTLPESRVRILWIIANLPKNIEMMGKYYTVIGYCRCNDGKLRVAFVHYSRSFSKIYCKCVEVKKPWVWGKSHIVLLQEY
jgi:hypothetical protein